MSDTRPYALLLLLVGLAGLAAILSGRLSRRFSVPAPAIFLAAAAVYAAVVDGVLPEEKLVERIVTVALLCILFDGGRHIGWDRMRASAAPVLEVLSPLGALTSLTLRGYVLTLKSAMALRELASLNRLSVARVADTHPVAEVLAQLAKLDHLNVEDEAMALDAVLGARVSTYLRELPDGQRRCLVLAYWGGYTMNEIATMTGVPVGTVKTRCRSALTNLRRTFVAQGLVSPARKPTRQPQTLPSAEGASPSGAIPAKRSTSTPAARPARRSASGSAEPAT